jgi:hypothetical protein
MPIHAAVSDCCLVYLDVVIITELQDLVSGKIGVVVGDDRFGDPKAEDNVFDNAYWFFGANFGHVLSLDPLSELVDRDKQVGEAPGRFFWRVPKGPGPTWQRAMLWG